MSNGILHPGSTLRNDFTNPYAYDLSKNILTEVEVINDKAINVSIENILLTIFGERVFVLSFGSLLQLSLFDAITTSDAVGIFESVLDAIEAWETRVILDRQNAKLDLFLDNNTMLLQIPYTIRNSGIQSNFKKKVIL
jgi:phage baseplate assembly protein W